SYIVIHELTHLWEGNHGERFKARMDESYPAWRQRREELKRLAYML
ncbi:MAG TPA: M48 family peptidase, partial [Acidaminococcaceae bacterium]|nr:M48 family peptidase [Acidaminococcaceae bacterium]